MDTARALVERELFDVPSTDDLFNLYRDAHPDLDRQDAAVIRRDNLAAYLESYVQCPDLFLLAEAPGPWGCRFSGVPVTSEAQLLDPSFPIGGRASGRHDEPHSEYSANIFWRLLMPWFPRFFVWNSVPLHPHRRGEPLSIRAPRTSELRRFEPLTAAMIQAVSPRRVLAIGRKAEAVLTRINVEATYVRHPSQGGATEFAAGIRGALADLGLAPDGHG